jgi:hypothetical protein
VASKRFAGSITRPPVISSEFIANERSPAPLTKQARLLTLSRLPRCQKLVLYARKPGTRV